VPETLTDQLRLMAEHYPDEQGFVDLSSGAALTFGAWDAEANRLARGLAARGVATGDRVLLLVDAVDALRWVTAHAAIQKGGAVAVPVSTRLAPRELADIVGHAEPAAGIVSPALTGLVAAAGRHPDLVVLTGPAAPGPAIPAASVLPWEEVATGDGSPLIVPSSPDDIADIVYTSGTTGRPKGVVVRHANASLIPNGVPAWTGAGWLACSPLFTFAGMTAVYNPMKLGMTSLYLGRFDAGAWLRHVEERRPAMVFLVPAMAELLLAHPGIGGADLSSIGLCAIGSAPLAPETQRRLAALMPAASVSNAYGMTEAGPAYTVLPKEETQRRAGSVGRPLPPADFFTVDELGRRLGPDQVGELVIRLPGRPREYYRDPEATASTWHHDGLHTGDLARIDADGYVYVVGRLKEVIIRGGHNVHAADVEAAIYEHPGVAEAVVAGIEHPVLGEDVAAWVVLRPGATATAQELQTWAADRLADYKVPRRITFVAALPRNATGKVVKAELPPPAPAG
jgi:acyl-CoA synthetase (AMP-forming)/AMP-acid ligase II